MLSKDNMSSFNNKKITDILIDMKKQFNEYKTNTLNNLEHLNLENNVSSRLDDNKFFYDTSAAQTTTEKIFFKWCKKLGLIDNENNLNYDLKFCVIL